MGLFNWNSHRSNNKTSNKDFGHSLKESGNVFLMLFGAVGMVGVIGASTMTVMKGPVKTMSEVTKRTLAENNMIAAGKLALIAATQNSGGDCDTDGTIEPIAMSGSTIPGFTGGSEIPTQIGTSKEDSWGMPFGYCAWDHGTVFNSSLGCTGDNRLDGTDSGDQYVIAIVSAGPDGVFQTSCNAYVDGDSNGAADTPLVAKSGGSDDLFLGYTYSEAAAAAGGLWEEPTAGTAEIAKNVTIKDSGGTEQFAFDANAGTLSVGTSGEFPSIRTDNLQSITGSINLLSNVDALTADGAITGASLAAGSGAITGGSLNVGSGTLTAGASTLGATGVTSLSASGTVSGGSLTTSGTLNAGASTLGATGVSSLSASGLINTSGDATFGDDLTDTVGIAGNTTIGGTLGVTGTASLNRVNMTDSLRIQRDTASGPDIGFHASGLIEADNHLFLNIDSDNNDTNRALIVQKDSDTSAGTELFRINESGLVTVQGKITNLSAPTVDADAATKEYVDNQVTAGMSGFSETDPQVGNLGTGTAGANWCTSNGTEIICTASTPSETDPKVGTLTPGKQCTTDGTTINCTNDAVSGLPNCNTGEIAQFDGSNWACASESDIVAGQCTAGGQTWASQTGVEQSFWSDVAYGNGQFVAVATQDTNRIMTSPDGISWTPRVAPAQNQWLSITYGGGQFVAVANQFSGATTDRIMTSPDGINWSAHTAIDGNWSSITYGGGAYVAVAINGANLVMRSTDGINWTTQTPAAGSYWRGVSYGNGQFVAVGANSIMTSPDGITWTAQTSPESNNWADITYGGGRFVATAFSGTNRTMTSTDGINWTANPASENNAWYNVTYGNGTFIAVSFSGSNQVMTSEDGVNWSSITASEANTWTGVAFGDDKFVAVSRDGTNRVMTADAGSCTTNETDPQVGDIATSGQWCRSNGTEIICDLNDPTVAGSGDNLGDHTATQGVIFFKVTGAAAPTK